MKSYWIYIIFIIALYSCSENTSKESDKGDLERDGESKLGSSFLDSTDEEKKDITYSDSIDTLSTNKIALIDAKPALIDTIDYQYQEWYPGRKKLRVQGMFDEQYKRHGKWVFYDKNGIELSMTTYTHNLKQGFSIVKYPNGVIYYRGEYNQDKKVGLWTFYNDKGEKGKEIIYNYNGEKVNEINYDTE